MAITDRDKNEYNANLEDGEASGDGKQQDLVYYLVVQPRHP
jgi:hypothetical protein